MFRTHRHLKHKLYGTNITISQACQEAKPSLTVCSDTTELGATSEKQKRQAAVAGFQCFANEL